MTSDWNTTNDAARPASGGYDATYGTPSRGYDATYQTSGSTQVSGVVTPGGSGSSAHIGDERSLGEIMGDLTQNVSTLMRQEVALAKAEVAEAGKRAGKGVGMLAGAGLAGNLMITFLSLGLWWAIGIWIGNHDHPALGWSGLIMAVLWGIVAAVLALSGRAQLKQVNGLPRTTETVQQIPDALKGHEENNR